MKRHDQQTMVHYICIICCISRQSFSSIVCSYVFFSNKLSLASYCLSFLSMMTESSTVFKGGSFQAFLSSSSSLSTCICVVSPRNNGQMLTSVWALSCLNAPSFVPFFSQIVFKHNSTQKKNIILKSFLGDVFFYILSLFYLGLLLLTFCVHIVIRNYFRQFMGNGTKRQVYFWCKNLLKGIHLRVHHKFH